MRKICDYHNRNYMSHIKCGLDKNHDGDHAFLFKTHPQDIVHDHQWVEMERRTYMDSIYPDFRWKHPPRPEDNADAMYQCKVCNRKRYEYK